MTDHYAKNAASPASLTKLFLYDPCVDFSLGVAQEPRALPRFDSELLCGLFPRRTDISSGTCSQDESHAHGRHHRTQADRSVLAAELDGGGRVAPPRRPCRPPPRR